MFLYSSRDLKDLRCRFMLDLEYLSEETKNLTLVLKEFSEVNLSIISYIKEVKKRIPELHTEMANKDISSYEVVKILSNKCKYNKMSESPSTPQKRIPRNISKKSQDQQDKNKNELQQINKFISWYKHMIDDERPNIVLYLSDDVILEWFGRTIKTRKKVSSFLKHDMQYTRHDFVSVRSIDTIQSRQDREVRNEEHNLSDTVKSERNCKRKIFRSNCSPDWAEGCQPLDNNDTRCKKSKHSDSDIGSDNSSICQKKSLKRAFEQEDCADFNSKGDVLDRRVRRKYLPVTPPNCELGQGDCIPSTSGTNSDRSHDALNAQLSKLNVECNGFIQFTRTRNNRSNEAMKWERKCKVQISFSEDPLNIGEYIIWAIHYTDESKCRRNLLSAFEEVALK